MGVFCGHTIHETFPRVIFTRCMQRGFTPLELALEAGHADAVAVLRADPRVQQHRDADRPAAGDDDDDDDDGRNDGSNTHDDPRGPIN